MCFMLFLWLCDFLQFLSVKYSKMFTAHRIQRDTNFKHDKSRVCKGSFLDVLETNLKCLSFTTVKKLVFPWERAPTKIKIITTSLPNFTNFTEENARRFIVSFAFCAHVDVTNVFLRARAHCLNFLLSRVRP